MANYEIPALFEAGTISAMVLGVTKNSTVQDDKIDTGSESSVQSSILDVD